MWVTSRSGVGIRCWLTDASGERHEQLLELLGGQVVLPSLGEALGQSSRQQLESCPFGSSLACRELTKDGNAVAAAFLEDPSDRLKLSRRATKPLDGVSSGVSGYAISVHGIASYTPRGMLAPTPHHPAVHTHERSTSCSWNSYITSPSDTRPT